MNKFILSIFSGLLLAFSWVETGFFPLVFFAFIPLLILEKNLSLKRKQSSLLMFGYSFLSFFLFNIITTYWIWHATIVGAFAAFIINAILMSLVMVLFHKVRYILGNKKGYLFFIFLWISMEFLHLNWELAWPWLTLGNVFASCPNLVQWYEYTGVLGGSLWILVINVLLYRFLVSKHTKDILVPCVIFLIPIAISQIIKLSLEKIPQKYEEVVIVQPNVDPYKDKFNRDAQQQLDDFIKISRTKITPKTNLLVGPETTLQETIWENKIANTESILKLRNLQKDFPNLNVLIGSSTFKYLGEVKETNSRKLRDNTWYNIYNTAIFLDLDSTISLYHKTKLVPGVEQIPYSFILNKIGDFTVDLGGTSGSLSVDNSIDRFEYNELKILPLICYESIFGDIITSRESNVIVIITNDGWWKNTSGYKQHFQYARLRAIEQRKSIIRSANTGISAVISPIGEIESETNWDEEVAINSYVAVNNTITFYNKFGDFLGRIFSFIAVLLLFSSIVKNKIKKIPTRI